MIIILITSIVQSWLEWILIYLLNLLSNISVSTATQGMFLSSPLVAMVYSCHCPSLPVFWILCQAVLRLSPCLVSVTLNSPTSPLFEWFLLSYAVTVTMGGMTCLLVMFHWHNTTQFHCILLLHLLQIKTTYACCIKLSVTSWISVNIRYPMLFPYRFIFFSLTLKEGKHHDVHQLCSNSSE